MQGKTWLLAPTESRAGMWCKGKKMGKTVSDNKQNPQKGKSLNINFIEKTKAKTSKPVIQKQAKNQNHAKF